jgi:hypothetical protein
LKVGDDAKACSIKKPPSIAGFFFKSIFRNRKPDEKVRIGFPAKIFCMRRAQLLKKNHKFNFPEEADI